MTYEERMRLLQYCRPDKRDILFARLLKGEQVDITKDSDLFYQINADRMSMDAFMDRNEFVEDAKEITNLKQTLKDTKYGKTGYKKGLKRWICDIPPKVWFTHPWFSPMLPKEERDANIRKWANMFPKFRIGEKEI